jgi:large subunit ribosomal protein L35
MTDGVLRLDSRRDVRHNARPPRPWGVNGAPMVGARPPGATGTSGAHLVMPKMKTNRAAAKRFKITGTGRVRRSKAGLNHMMQEKSKSRCRRLRKNDMVEPALEKRVKLMLPYG